MTEEAEQTKGRGISRRTFLLGGSALFAGGIVTDALLEPQTFRIEEMALPLAKVAPGRELRIVQISDLHIRSFGGYFRRVAQAVNALAPELILLTGDYLERSRNIRGVQRFLRLLQAPLGVFAVQGNWEFWARVEGENLRRHFAAAGATLLINERRDLEVQGIPLSLLGLDYPSSADLLQQLQASAEPNRLNLLLSHVPAFAHELLDGRIDLILCGHTHGGQIRVPFVPPFYLPRFSGRFVAGAYQVGPTATPLYVTRGVGTSIFPVRFLCRPEITLFRLLPA